MVPNLKMLRSCSSSLVRSTMNEPVSHEPSFSICSSHLDPTPFILDASTDVEMPLTKLKIDWDSIESHKQFMVSPGYAAFTQKLGTLTAKAPQLFHFVPQPFPPAILSSAAVVEVATFFQTEDSFLSNVEQFMAATAPQMVGYLGHVFGPVVEEIEKEGGTGAGMGSAVVLCIGWESRERHMAFRETESFKQNIHLLREGVKGAEMVSRALCGERPGLGTNMRNIASCGL